MSDVQLCTALALTWVLSLSGSIRHCIVISKANSTNYFLSIEVTYTQINFDLSSSFTVDDSCDIFASKTANVG